MFGALVPRDLRPVDPAESPTQGEVQIDARVEARAAGVEALALGEESPALGEGQGSIPEKGRMKPRDLARALEGVP